MFLVSFSFLPHRVRLSFMLDLCWARCSFLFQVLFLLDLMFQPLGINVAFKKHKTVSPYRFLISNTFVTDHLLYFLISDDC